jgi:hypothetical protein
MLSFYCHINFTTNIAQAGLVNRYKANRIPVGTMRVGIIPGGFGFWE